MRKVILIAEKDLTEIQRIELIRFLKAIKIKYKEQTYI